MHFPIFIVSCLFLNLILSFFVHFKRYRLPLTYPLFGLAVIFPLNSFIGSLLGNTTIYFGAELTLRLYYASYIVSTLLLKEFTKRFLLEEELKIPFSLTFFTRMSGIIATVCFLTLPVFQHSVINGVWFTALNSMGVVVISVQLIIALYSLFILENTYRFAQEYQRRIARLCFLALAVIIVFQLFFSGYLLLYKTISEKMIYLATVVYGVTYPVLLIGLLRYRLGSERISVPRNAVFSTISLLLSGAAFLGIGTTVIVFKQFNIDFSYFEQTLIVFTLCLFSLLVIGSGTMRKRIVQFMNTIVYSHKYDYREQFYNLHRSYMTGEDVEGSLTEIIENMKFSAAADDAFVFLTNDTDGHLYMHENKESATASDCVIRGDSPIVKELSRTPSPVRLNEWMVKTVTGPMDGSDAVLLETIKADIVFPISNRRRLLGVLAIKLRPKAKLDNEDIALIEVFANSIGDVLFKNKVLTERVERKQFESFSHLSSFIIHDIKNQTATLSLLVGNADKNINNPEFQKSLLGSLRSCTENLQRLVEKLKSPPKSDALKLNRVDVNAVIGRMIENTGLAALGAVAFVFNKGAVGPSELDEESLFYTVKNLVVNSLEAMNNRGTLTIATGTLLPPPDGLLKLFDSGKEFFTAFCCYIMVSDTGCGMSREFMEKKLFHPFASTKDKGIGIGLYHCKTLVEKMGGKIMCHSEVNRGTDFCILL